MTQVQKINRNDENSIQKESNSFETCEEIVLDLIEKGIPNSYNPDIFISRVSRTYGITYREAKSCVRLALKQIDKTQENDISDENLNGNSGYFWKTGYTTSSNFKSKNDGMDSLSSLGSYNKLIFGIK